MIDLTVRDTKALQLGTLLGRMHKCICGTQYYVGLPACPECGEPAPKPGVGAGGGAGEEEEPEFRGMGLSTTLGSIFDAAFSAWYMADDGCYSCTLGSKDGAIVILPPAPDEDAYRLLVVPKDRGQKIKIVGRNNDLSSLILGADQRVKKDAAILGNKNAGWRSADASNKQKSLIISLGGHPGIESMTQGEAAQVITHKFAMKRVSAFANKLGVKLGINSAHPSVSPLPSPITAREEDQFHMVAVQFKRTTNTGRDRRRYRRLFETLISYSGEDQFEIVIITPEGEKQTISYPNHTTKLCAALEEELQTKFHVEKAQL